MYRHNLMLTPLVLAFLLVQNVRGQDKLAFLPFHHGVQVGDRLVAKQAHVALLCPADRGFGLDQRVFLAFAGVAALRAHHHQPAALEDLADQADAQANNRAKQCQSQATAGGLG